MTCDRQILLRALCTSGRFPTGDLLGEFTSLQSTTGEILDNSRKLISSTAALADIFVELSNYPEFARPLKKLNIVVASTLLLP